MNQSSAQSRESGGHLRYILQTMLSEAHLRELAGELSVELKGVKGKAACVDALISNVTLDILRLFCVARWSAPAVDQHLRNLKSGLLRGHSWHNTAPSRLHLSLQGKVRALGASLEDLARFIEVGADIARHEYYMVAVADLCEHALVTRCDAIPAILSKSLSDLVLEGVPYDVKNVSAARGWPLGRIHANPAIFAAEMMAGADTERVRKQAETVQSPAPFNRMFIAVEDEDIWLQQPEALLDQLVARVNARSQPLQIAVGDRHAEVLVITLGDG